MTNTSHELWLSRTGTSYKPPFRTVGIQHLADWRVGGSGARGDHGDFGPTGSWDGSQGLAVGGSTAPTGWLSTASASAEVV